MKKPSFLTAAFALAALLVAGTAQLAHAESLAARVPADAVAYAQWAGSDTLAGTGKSYDNSHLKKLLDVLNLPQLVSQRMQEDLEKKAANPQKLADAKLAQDLLPAVIKAPTALYFGPLDFANPQQPNPHIAIFSRLGPATAAEFAKRINETYEVEKEKGPPAIASVAGDYLLITIGSDMADFAKRLTGPILPDNLAAVAAFKDTLTRVDALTTPPAALVYVDAEAVLKIIDDAVAAKGGPGRDAWPKARDAFHFDALHQFAWAGNFDAAGNWIDQAFLGLSADRVGIAAFLDHKPLSDATLKLIPKSVTFAGVGRFDAARFLDDLRDAADKMDPQRGAQMFDMGLRQFFAFTGVDLRKDIVDNLTDEFAFYSSPEVAGNSLESAILATRVVDGQKLDTAFSTFETTINAMIAQRNPDSQFQVKTESLPAPDDKITAHVLTLDKFSPAWAINDNILYIAASTAAIQSAIDNQAAEQRRLLENRDFAALFKSLGQEKVASFLYIDLPKVAAELYPFASSALSHRLAAHPEEKNPYILPPLDKITPTLSPALSITWSDKDGFHARSIGPFPLANILTPQAIMGALVRSQQHKTAKPPADTEQDLQLAPKP